MNRSTNRLTPLAEDKQVTRTRAAIAHVMLWLAVINGAVWLGGTVFMMLVFNPLWTASPPDSVRAYWVDGRFYETIFNFFGPAWQVVRAGSVLGALVACWTLPRTRTWLLLSAATKVPALILTRAYIYPMNTLLFTPAIASLPAETARELTERWIVADRIRFVVMFAGFLALLRAFRLPLPPAHRASDR